MTDSKSNLELNSEALLAVLEAVNNLPLVLKPNNGTVTYDESTKTLTIVDE